MVESILRRFVEYKKKKQAVIIVTLLTTLVAVWPAVDEYTAARARRKEAKAALVETKEEIAKLPQHEQLYAKKTAELRELEQRTVSDKVAQGLRNKLVQLVRDTDCTMRRIRLDDPTRRDWMESDDPIDGTRLADPGAETPFQLETRQLSLSITGTMPNIHRFLSQMHKIDKMIHTRSIALKRFDRKGGATLDLDFYLFDFVRKAES